MKGVWEPIQIMDKQKDRLKRVEDQWAVKAIRSVPATQVDAKIQQRGEGE